MGTGGTTSGTTGVRVRTLREDEVAEADRIMRVAFGTFVGLDDPATYLGDADLVRTRFAAEPAAALAAEVDGALVGTNFVARWGSVGYFGPLTVLPALWDRGVARALLDATMELFERWGVEHRGLFTFAQSPKHLALYQRYGFFPRFLTAILAGAPGVRTDAWTTVGSVRDPHAVLDAAAEVTGSVLEGLDVRREILAVSELGLGDTVLVHDGEGLEAFAVCHVGPGTEAGSGQCYVKFGAARGGPSAPERFRRLVDAVETFAAAHVASSVTCGVSTGRRGAYRLLLERGYRAGRIGVTMHAPDVDAYHHAGAYVLDDWR
ncbi:MAG: GNAT family N-acetyltransferase [Acidimicrobiales bacterium]